MAARKSKKRRLKLFYPIYFSRLIAAIAGILVVSSMLAETLEAYEASLPKYVAEDVAQMFMDRDFEKVYSYQDPAQFANEDAATYAEYMRQFTEGGELTWGESYSSGEDVKVYAVRLNGKRLFEFKLEKLPEPDANGNTQWALSSVSTLGVSTAKHTVTAPADSTVYVGGKALDASQIIEEGIIIEEEKYLLNEDCKSPTMCVYEYEVCFGKPEVRVVDAKGRENPVTMDENGNAYAELNSNDELKAEAEERVFEIVKAFANFTSEDLTQRNMLKLARKGTNAYKNIQEFDNNWFGKHYGVKFENMVSDNYIAFSEDTFGCDISFDYIVDYRDSGEVRYETRYRFYFVERDDEWYLYDFKMVNE